jgi:hypothetical protein
VVQVDQIPVYLKWLKWAVSLSIRPFDLVANGCEGL